MTKSGRRKGSKPKSSSNSKEIVSNVRTVSKKSKKLKEKNLQKKHETKRKPKSHDIHGKKRQSNAAHKRTYVPSYAERKLPMASMMKTQVPWSISRSNSKSFENFHPEIPSCLPYKNMISDAALLQLDIELSNFAKYVRLTEREISTRNAIIAQIEKLLLSMWPQGNVQKFGSFATEEVCTFCSDVDLAFWGVVPTDNLDQRDDWKDGTVIMSKESYDRTMEIIDRKKERVKAWEKLLDDVDFMGNLREEKESAGCDKEENSSIDKTNAKENGQPLIKTRQTEHVQDDVDTDNRESDLKSSTEDEIADRTDQENPSNPMKDSNQGELNADFFVIDRCGTQDTPNIDRSISYGESDSEDSVDKMAEYHRREQHGRETSSDNGDEEDFELNISQKRSTDFGAPASAMTRTKIVSGQTRQKVVNALKRLGKRLWKESFAQNVQVRKGAKVPIVCMTTRYGFDADMALGGHNGMDTSHYVRKCVEKFESFATVVLFLKILLQHTDLDKPFTGGLGSYRLYVLVAKHFNEHNNLGGGMTSAEILISFFYRYSAMNCSSSKGRTYLHKSYIIMSEDGEADLSAVNVEDCIDVFQHSFQRLLDKLIDFDSSIGENKESLIACLIDAARLNRDRCVAINKSNVRPAHRHISENDPGKVTKSSKPVTHTFSKGSEHTKRGMNNHLYYGGFFRKNKIK